MIKSVRLVYTVIITSCILMLNLCPSGDDGVRHQVFRLPLRRREGQMDREPAAGHQTQQGTAVILEVT